MAPHRFIGAVMGERGWSTDENVVGVMADVVLTTSVKAVRLDYQKVLRGAAQVSGETALALACAAKWCPASTGQSSAAHVSASTSLQQACK
jgi:hypothetical protein